jgi:hypothetical protein
MRQLIALILTTVVSSAVAATDAPSGLPTKPKPVTPTKPVATTPIKPTTPPRTPCMQSVDSNEYAAYQYWILELMKLFQELARAVGEGRDTTSIRNQIIAAEEELMDAMEAYYAAIAACNEYPTPCVSKLGPITNGFVYWDGEITKKSCGLIMGSDGKVRPYVSVTPPNPLPSPFTDKASWYGYCVQAYFMKSKHCLVLLPAAKDKCYTTAPKPWNSVISSVVNACTPKPVKPVTPAPNPQPGGGIRPVKPGNTGNGNGWPIWGEPGINDHFLPPSRGPGGSR